MRPLPAILEAKSLMLIIYANLNNLFSVNSNPNSRNEKQIIAYDRDGFCVARFDAGCGRQGFCTR